jgi:hypothetical protein
MSDWINTEREAVNMAQVCRIEFEYHENSDIAKGMRLHCADGESVRVFNGDPGWDEIAAMLAEHGIVLAEGEP